MASSSERREGQPALHKVRTSRGKTRAGASQPERQRGSRQPARTGAGSRENNIGKMRRFHAIAYQVAICELGTLSRWALPQHQDHVHRTSSAATFGTPQPQEVRLLRTRQRLQPELMRWPHPADDEVAGLHVKDVPKERLSCRRDLRLARMHRRLELCADSSVVAPRGWPGAH
jgi:hypothetical protein